MSTVKAKKMYGMRELLALDRPRDEAGIAPMVGLAMGLYAQHRENANDHEALAEGAKRNRHYGRIALGAIAFFGTVPVIGLAVIQNMTEGITEKSLEIKPGTISLIEAEAIMDEQPLVRYVTEVDGLQAAYSVRYDLPANDDYLPGSEFFSGVVKNHVPTGRGYDVTTNNMKMEAEASTKKSSILSDYDEETGIVNITLEKGAKVKVNVWRQDPTDTGELIADTALLTALNANLANLVNSSPKLPLMPEAEKNGPAQFASYMEGVAVTAAAAETADACLETAIAAVAPALEEQAEDAKYEAIKEDAAQAGIAMPIARENIVANFDNPTVKVTHNWQKVVEKIKKREAYSVTFPNTDALTCEPIPLDGKSEAASNE